MVVVWGHERERVEDSVKNNLMLNAERAG